MKRFVVAVGLVAASFPVAGGVPAACAAADARAVLVVDMGEGDYSFCVALPDDSVSGIELIALAGEQHGLDYRLGYGGRAVCMLAGVGAEGDDCFGEHPYFWGYWRGGAGGWSWSSVGAASTSVSDGDVEGWSWGTGQDGSSHPPPPATTFGSVCPPAPADNPRSPEGRSPAASGRAPAAGSPAGGTVPAPTAASPGKTADTRPADKGPADERAPRGKPKDRSDGPGFGATRAFARGPAAAPPVPADPGGPPSSGVAALVAAGALGVGGLLLRRRRTD